MITVTFSEDKKKVVLSVDGGTLNCCNAQVAADLLAFHYPGQPVHWDIQPNKLNSLGQGYATKIVQEFEAGS